MQSEFNHEYLKRQPVDEDERKWRTYGAYAQLGAGFMLLALLVTGGVSDYVTHRDGVAGVQQVAATSPAAGERAVTRQPQVVDSRTSGKPRSDKAADRVSAQVRKQD
jgi:hypothetical protein